MNTKEKLIKATVAIFARKGYENTSIDEIVAKAKIAKGTFYYHFKSKEEIFFELIDQGIKSLIKKAQARLKDKISCQDKLNAVIEAQTEYFYDHRDICKIIFMQGAMLKKRWKEYINKLKSQYIVIIKEILSSGKNDGVFAIDDVEFVANRVFDTIAFASLDGIIFIKEKSRNDIIKNTKSFIFRGILK